ncbi:MAG: hypothetical protein WCS37_08155 [Chloroflexota bacterium]|nr:hypothetical protein [Chloroflexota bacterium]
MNKKLALRFAKWSGKVASLLALACWPILSLIELFSWLSLQINSNTITTSTANSTVFLFYDSFPSGILSALVTCVVPGLLGLLALSMSNDEDEDGPDLGGELFIFLGVTGTGLHLSMLLVGSSNKPLDELMVWSLILLPSALLMLVSGFIIKTTTIL